ncbi:alpha/beta fold hydrolase [Reichenbachiella versicolor]|uniref:alpha/beta fold hydrolase n=1 Tax=Reichenbachiella versicolor TaxID=1821036 RepID=UPI000D6DF25E|nr:alpha/beta hydrolase [Reichenbachiella versicolor]
MKYINISKISSLIWASLIISISSCNSIENEQNKKSEETIPSTATVFYKKKEIQGVNIFYREAGNPKKPALILWHGFPSSSHQYRKVLAALGDDYYIIAPDYPSFGASDYPDPNEFEYTFDHLAEVMDEFLTTFNLPSYTFMMQDYGAPIGYRIIMKHPKKIKGLIIQNGNIYEEGLGKGWEGIRKIWADNSEKNRIALYDAFSLEGLKWQYTHGVKDLNKINPDTWFLDYQRMQRPGIIDMNINLFYDYKNNLKLYPQWQSFLRKNQPPLLIVWGKNDAFFPESGARAYKEDVKMIDYNIYDTGHFALEEYGTEIIEKIRRFMNKTS